MTPSNADLAVMVLCASDANQIWYETGVMAGGNPTLPKKSAPGIAYVTDQHWVALGQLRCDDLFIARGRNVYYGLVLRCVVAIGPFRPGDHLVTIRGTMDPLEWANDACAEVLVSAAGVSGAVGSGFWDVYASMTVRQMGGGRQAGTAAQAIADLVKAAPAPVYLVGHSLGAALATYLAADLQAALAPLGVDFTPAFFASPKPGSSDFVDGYQARVSAYTLVDFAADLVPMLPSSPPSVALRAGGVLHNVKMLQRGSPGSPPWPELNPVQNHDPARYALMLDPANATARALVGA
jgi:hypothetical protein